MVIVEAGGATEDVQRELAWLCALVQSWYLSGPRLPQARPTGGMPPGAPGRGQGR